MTSTLPAGLPAPAGPDGRTVTGLARLTFRTPERSFELAVPADVPVAELLPTVLELGGSGSTDLAERGLGHEGWVLQRLGGEILDAELTVGRLELRDGEVLHLRARTEALPSVNYDDLVEGVAEAMRSATPEWGPRASRIALLAAVVVALAGGLVALCLTGDHVARAATAGFAGLLLLGAALSAAQAVGDRALGALFGLGGVGYLAAAGAIVVSGDAGTDLTGPRLLAGGIAALAASALATAAVAWAPPFAASGLIAFGVLAGGVTVLAGGDAEGGAVGPAAVAVVVALVAGHFAPALAFRFAGLRLPALPGTAAQLQEDIEPHPANLVTARSKVAAVLLDSLSVGAGVLLAAALAGLAFAADWPGWALAGAVCVLLLVHQRGLDSGTVRAAAIVPGVVGLLLLGLHLMLGVHGTERLVVGVGAVLLAVLTAATAATVPGRRVLPYWGRIADLLHTFAALAVLPLAVLAVGVYGVLRGLGS